MFCYTTEDIMMTFLGALSGVSTIISPAAFVSAVAVTVSALAATLPLIGPGAGSFLYQWCMGILGLLPSRKKTWGTVYDARTKRPIPFAKVQLLDRNRRVLETRIADSSGRYGFLTTPESLSAQRIAVYLASSRAGYVFPSRTPASVDGLVYGNLYYGDLIEVSDQALLNVDIPLDPIAIPSAPPVRISPSIALGISVAAIADIGFWLGLAIVPLGFALQPDPFSFGVLCVFLGTASLRLFGITEHPFGVVRDARTGHALPFALITIDDATGKRAGFAISDERGRYFLVVGHGMYNMTISTPATIRPLRQAKLTVNTRKGWITRELQV